MAEIATIARPYAEALFEACKGNLDAASGWVTELGVLTENAQLQQYAADPNVTVAQVFDLIGGLVKSPLPAEGKNFLQALLDNGRLLAMPEIARQFQALKNAANGAADAVVYSAFPMTDAQCTELAATLEKKFGRKLLLAVTVDPSLIGGVRVVVGDEVLDASVKGKLEQMKVSLVS